MTDRAKPIETVWRGYRFRSRTEARWAVAFTAAGVKFEYEAEGFKLPSGWYLPDFWLPEVGAWLEIKGVDPNTREIALARELAALGRGRVLIAVGPPDPVNDYLTLVPPSGDLFEELFQMPSAAYAAARGERFDGSPGTAPSKPTTKRWW